MQSNPSLSLYLPGALDRELWSCEQDEWRRSDVRSAGAEGVFVIEAMALESVPFWAVEPKDGHLDAGRVASLKWESLGLGEDKEGKAWIHWNVGHSGNRVLLGSAGLAAEATKTDWLKMMPKAFEISPRLFPIPPGEAALWQELGRYVVAFMHGEQLVHFSIMGARLLNGEAASEIRDLVWAMQVQGFLRTVTGIRVWTTAEPSFVVALKDMLSVPVHFEDKPAPRLPDGVSDLCPPEVARVRRERVKKRQRSQMIMALAALYVAFFAVWAGWLSWREHKLGRETAKLAALRPEVERVQREQMRWQVLETATNVDQYPTELFQKIVSLLPPEGIRLKEFDLDLNKLVISGEASSIGHAKKFQADVTGSEGLRQYTWNFPQPTFLDDNRANFRAEGILTTGGVHEGQ